MMKRVFLCVLLSLVAYQGVFADEKSKALADEITSSCTREAGIETGPGKVITPEQMARFTACVDRRTTKIKR